MLEYCDPPAGIFEWREKRESWADSDDELGAKRALAHALNAPRASTASVDSLKQRFEEHAAKWERETRHLSSPTQRMMHPSYQAVLGMGREHQKEIVSLLIRDMQDHDRPWFAALSYITNENPIDRADAGKMNKMIESWVKWAKSRGVL